KAVFIDTEGTFSPSRIKAVHARLQSELGWEKSFEDVLKDITYARAYNSDHQMSLVERLLELFYNHKDEYGLVAVDSATAHFRAEYAGRGTLAERQQTINHHLGILGRIADTYTVAIAITNQVQSNPAAFFGDPTQAIGGNILGHWAITRFYLRKSKGEKRIIRIYDSPYLPESEAVFAITPEGCVDVEGD
ncbi:MAG: DNA repair and recombination protein RadA, partial [Candidatus Heimdallarchaeota archaeon]|nr:DNA repair and recombination protein RadA [Candidatus Heimdallarchaeota archaeon]